MGSVQWNFNPINSDNNNSAIIIASALAAEAQVPSDATGKYSKILLNNEDLQKRKNQADILRRKLNYVKS